MLNMSNFTHCKAIQLKEFLLQVQQISCTCNISLEGWRVKVFIGQFTLYLTTDIKW